MWIEEAVVYNGEGRQGGTSGLWDYVILGTIYRENDNQLVSFRAWAVHYLSLNLLPASRSNPIRLEMEETDARPLFHILNFL